MSKYPFEAYGDQTQVCPCCGQPYQPFENPNSYQNPMFNPMDQRFQSCRNYCLSLGLTPGTPAWRNCVHSCMMT